MNKSYPKYLKRNVIDHIIEPIPSRKYSQLVVIPALDELEYVEDTLNSIAGNSAESLLDTAVIVVVNNSANTPNEKVDNNQELLRLFRTHVLDCATKINLFWIDASSTGLEIQGDGGVGTARKIGMDGMLPFLTNEALIFSLDADTLVSDNYLSAARGWFDDNPTIPTGVIHFEHRFDSDNTKQAIIDYELFMRQFTIGLRQINSWYDYYSIGSAIVIRSVDYVKAGGMRIKNGGEDFYFMQAARKIGSVGGINSTTVYPSARVSDRVDFGTGPKMQQLVDGDEIRGYNPEVFQTTLSLFKIVDRLDPEQFEFLSEAFEAELPIVACQFFSDSNFNKVWGKVYRNTPKTVEKLVGAFHIWFDALRTLRFVHHLEEGDPVTYGRIPIADAYRCMADLYQLGIPDEMYATHESLLIWLRDNRM